MTRVLSLATLILFAMLLVGCGGGFGERAEYGITFYCPGAGNVDMGDAGIREGLERAGYRGQVSRFTWSVGFNPVIDQTVQPIARIGAQRLAGHIEHYIDRYPGCEVNVVGLSAGSGVAIWALENLKPGYKVNNVILLASSLSADYDVGRALRSVKGNIYNYYSPNDAVLTQLMKLANTIDGHIGADGAGAVGLRSAHGGSRVVNVRWRPEFRQYGYHGGHTDGTSPAFVHHELSQYIVTPHSAGLLDNESSWQLLAALRNVEPKQLAVANASHQPSIPAEAVQLMRLPIARSATPKAPPRRPTLAQAAYRSAPVPAQHDPALNRMMRVLSGERVFPVVTEDGLVPSEVEAAKRVLTAIEGKYHNPFARSPANSQ